MIYAPEARATSRADAIERARILLDAGASLSARDEEYRSTPLAWAARANIPEMVDFLLACGAPTNLPDDRALGHASGLGRTAGPRRGRRNPAEAWRPQVSESLDSTWVKPHATFSPA